MPNNPADVPLLTPDQAAAEIIQSKELFPAKTFIWLEGLRTGKIITKSAAAEEADRARIVELQVALVHFGEHKDGCPDTTMVPPDGCTCGLYKALSGCSENG